MLPARWPTVLFRAGPIRWAKSLYSGMLKFISCPGCAGNLMGRLLPRRQRHPWMADWLVDQSDQPSLTATHAEKFVPWGCCAAPPPSRAEASTHRSRPNIAPLVRPSDLPVEPRCTGARPGAGCRLPEGSLQVCHVPSHSPVVRLSASIPIAPS